MTTSDSGGPTADDDGRAGGSRAGVLITYVLRGAGVILLALVLFPVYRLIDRPDAGLFLRGSIAVAEFSRTLLFLGSVITIAVAVILSRILDTTAVDRALASLGRKLAAVPTLWFAGGLALMAFALTLAFSLVVLEGKPNLVDAMVQLVHGRFIAAGKLAGPGDEFLEFWQLQNSLLTPNGWVSQYPPGYVILLAAGLRVGMVQLVGPLLAAMTVFFTALAAQRLLREDIVAARLGAVMLCFCPFLIGLAGAFMNHVGAAAFSSAAVYLALRSRDSGNFGWALLTGTAVGIVLSIRPLSAIVATTVVVIIWLANGADAPRSQIGGFLKRSLAATVGISPLLVGLAAYNQYFFGSPLTFGYTASQGPLVGPGFHRDPTGAVYGPIQAIGFTSSDLTTYSLYLLETPIPAVLVAALFLVLAKRFSTGERVIASWALIPVAANALYWHHGMFMGPRMLNEAAPAWALLIAVAAVGLIRMLPRERTWGNYSPRAALTLTFLLAWGAGLVYLGPQRLASYGGPWMESSRLRIGDVDRRSLVFVHGAWTGRVAMRLVANGMRLDSLEAAMRQNETCDTHRYALWYSRPIGARRGAPPPLDFSFIPRNPPPQINISSGNGIRIRPGARWPRECLREVASDTLGIVDVGPLLWQGDLPGIGGSGAMFVRDMGPEANARLIRKYPDRVPLMLLRLRDDQPPTVVPYEEGVKLLWPGAG